MSSATRVISIRGLEYQQHGTVASMPDLHENRLANYQVRYYVPFIGEVSWLEYPDRRPLRG